MATPIVSIPRKTLSKLGLRNTESIHYQFSSEELIQDTLRIGEGVLNDTGALVIRTGEFTGRSPKDKFIVKDEITADTVHWAEFNQPIEPAHFDIIQDKVMKYLDSLPEIWIRDCYACADPRYRLNVRCVNEKPWNNLFAYNMFLRPEEKELENFEPEWQVIAVEKNDPDRRHRLYGRDQKRNFLHSQLYPSTGKKCIEHAL
jgi:phosphoenolpyruvate carboxykinase (ATP)